MCRSALSGMQGGPIESGYGAANKLPADSTRKLSLIRIPDIKAGILRVQRRQQEGVAVRGKQVKGGRGQKTLPNPFGPSPVWWGAARQR